MQLQRAMAAEAEAAREARAKVVIMIIKMMVVVMSDDGDGDDPQDDGDGDLHHRNQVIAAEGEQKASRALKEAADVIQESPQALQVERAK